MSALLRAEGLVKHFKQVRAVDGVSFELHEGETLALVGESGCGKSTVGRLLLRLIEPTAGAVYFGGRSISVLKEREMRSLRREMQIIFQDPYGSLNPRMTVGDMLAEPLFLHKLFSGREKQRVSDLLSLVGLAPEHAARYPHEFSGGQRQRIAIARALIVKPKVVVLDEPTSALDVTIQKQVLELLASLQKKYGLSYILVTHDIDVVRAMAHRVMVMKDSRIVESGPLEQVLERSKSDYTRRLVEAGYA